MDFIDSYKIVLELRNHKTGKKRTEIYRNMSLSDYEVLYGTITDKIISVDMKMEPTIKGGK